MKKILVFIMVLMMVVPFQAFAVTPMELPQNPTEDFNGMFEIEVKTSTGWLNAGSIGFGKFQETKEIGLEEYLSGENALIKITQSGGGAAYLDAVFLGGEKAIKANGSEGKVLNKLCKEDLDVTPVGDGIVLEFTANVMAGKLSVTGRIENEVISKEPLQFPLANNYKIKNQITDFYSYKLNSNYGKIVVDGELDEVNNLDVFTKEYQTPGSGHPAGDTYFWVMNDDENLYVMMDFTPDNTYDGDKDYAKVYVNTPEGIKEFKVSVPDITYGIAGFTYTDKVVYEHKVYEFAIPLSEIGNVTDELEIAFVGYGTAAMLPFVGLPRLAYDPDNEIYLSVYQKTVYVDNGEYPQIYGQFVFKNDGGTESVCEEFLISDAAKACGFPDVAYDLENNVFLVVWEQYDLDYILEFNSITGKVIDVTNVDNFKIGPEINIISYSQEEFPNNASSPAIAYDDQQKQFLVVWEDRFMVNSGEDHFCIKGKFIKLTSDNTPPTISHDPLIISIQNPAPDVYPAVCYNNYHNSFLVVWVGYDNDNNSFMIQGNTIKSSGPNIIPKDFTDLINIGSGNDVYAPSISINNDSNEFLVSWGYGGAIYGKNIDLTQPVPASPTQISKDSNTYHSTSFYDGEGSMLCLWNDILNNEWNGYGNIKMRTFGQNEINYTRDPEPTDINYYGYNLYNLIDSCGDGNGEILVAYGRCPVDLVEDFIGYRFIEAEPQPRIQFEPDTYEVEVGLTTDATVKLYNYIPIYMRSMDGNINVTYEVIYEFDSDYVTVDSSGVITGIKPGETTIKAYWNRPDVMPTFMSMDYSEDDPYISEDALEAEAVVIVKPAKEPVLEFINDPYRIQIGNTLQAEVNYYDGENNNDVTNSVTYDSLDPEIATVSTSGAITGVAVGMADIKASYLTFINDVPTTLSAITSVEVYKKSTSRPAPEKPIIGQVIVDDKVVQNIYEDDLVSDGGIYSFEASKTGDNAKLWLLGSYYKQIANKNPKGTLQLVWDAASYNLPLKSQEVLTDANSIADCRVNIILEKVDDKELINSAIAAVDKLGGKMVSGLVDFDVTIESKSKKVNIDSYDFYVELTIDQLNKLDFYSTTAMKLIEDDEVFTFAPSVFDDDTATIKYRGNGIFAIVNNPKTFSDITNHWSKMNVEKLAARNIAFGKDNGIFAPNDFVTRAEFAVMITRALGITEEEGTMNFEDVKGWYDEDISTAYDAGLINGRGDGKFYPNEKILRKDMAVMILNAIKFADKEVIVKNIEGILSMFVDSSEISDYAKESTAICAEAGIIMGRDTKEFDADENATRAEASAIIERMLRYLEFIN